MKRWLTLALLAIALLAMGLWVWRVFFPDPERAVRKRLVEVAELASFGANEGAAAKLINSQKLASFFANDVIIRVTIPNYEQTFSGRDELARRAFMVRQFGSLNVRLFDIVVTVAPDGHSAVANLTVRAKTSMDSDLIVQELKVALKKDGLDWLVTRAETVKTLR
jgi:hypothetical protein